MISRGCAEIVEHFRSAIRKGSYRAGRLVPSSRELSTKYGVSAETARRGLKMLEQEGLLISEPRRGYRVAASEERTERARPVAFATDYLADLSNARATSRAVINALQESAGMRGWSTLGAHSAGGDREMVLEQLISGGAWGVIVDSLDPDYYRTLRLAKLPVVMVNAVLEGEEVDTVVQDNFGGGRIAAQHLLAAGARRIAWLGPARRSGHTYERHAGAVTALAAGGRSLGIEVSGELDDEGLRAAAREILSSRDRPDGVLAFDLQAVSALVEVCGKLGLTIGKELRVVGWLVEESLASDYVPIFRGGPVAPAIVWSASSMAEWALTLLAARREGGRGEPLRGNVPTRLKPM
jgi:LacI family transcriptional regulator